MMQSAEEIVRLFAVREGAAWNQRNEAQLIVDLVLPHADNVVRETTAGERGGWTRYDDTAVHATQQLANLWTATTTNPAQRWFQLGFWTSPWSKNLEVREWLDEVNDRMRMTLVQSNFYEARGEAHAHLCASGTMSVVMWPEQPRADGGFGGIWADLWPMGGYVLSEGHNTRVDTLMRRVKLTAVQAKAKFEGQRGFRSLSPQVSAKLAGEGVEKHTEQLAFMQGLLPDARQRGRYRSVWIDLVDKHMIVDAIVPEAPFGVGRFYRNERDLGWGRGPAQQCMASILRLNAIEDLDLELYRRDVDPPIIADDQETADNLRLRAGTASYVRRGVSITPFTTQIGQQQQRHAEKAERLRQQILRAFFLDFLEALIYQRPGNMSETEFLQKWRFFQQVLQPVLSRVESESYSPELIRLFGLMYRAGALPPAPPILEQSGVDAAQIPKRIEYTGVLARAIRRSDIDSMRELLAFGSELGVATGDLSHMDRIDAGKAMKQAALTLGVPADIERSDAEVDEVREDRARVAQQAQLLQALGGAGGAAASGPGGPGVA